MSSLSSTDSWLMTFPVDAVSGFGVMFIHSLFQDPCCFTDVVLHTTSFPLSLSLECTNKDVKGMNGSGK